MLKIKLSTIFLLISFGVFYVLPDVIDSWVAAMTIMTACFCVFVLLNFAAKKASEEIKKLVKWLDFTWILMFLVILDDDPFLLDPNRDVFWHMINHYFFSFLMLVFAGLLIAILVRVYQEEKV